MQWLILGVGLTILASGCDDADTDGEMPCDFRIFGPDVVDTQGQTTVEFVDGQVARVNGIACDRVAPMVRREGACCAVFQCGAECNIAFVHNKRDHQAELFATRPPGWPAVTRENQDAAIAERERMRGVCTEGLGIDWGSLGYLEFKIGDDGPQPYAQLTLRPRR